MYLVFSPQGLPKTSMHRDGQILHDFVTFAAIIDIQFLSVRRGKENPLRKKGSKHPSKVRKRQTNSKTFLKNQNYT